MGLLNFYDTTLCDSHVSLILMLAYMQEMEGPLVDLTMNELLTMKETLDRDPTAKLDERIKALRQVCMGRGVVRWVGWCGFEAMWGGRGVHSWRHVCGHVCVCKCAHVCVCVHVHVLLRACTCAPVRECLPSVHEGDCMHT